MSTIAEKLQIILNAKTAIKSAIEAKGVSDVGDKIEDYATKIGEISGSSSEYSDVDGMCYGISTITEFPEGWKFAPRSATHCIDMFYGCTSLTAIPQLDTTKGIDFSYMLFSCSNLTTLGGFVGLSKSLDLSSSTKLTHDSLMNVINNLATVTSSTKLTLGSTNLAKLTGEEKKVATDKGWTLA